MKLIYALDHITVTYAAEEFARLAAAVGMPDVEICKADTLPDAPVQDAVVLGLLADLGRDTSDLSDPFTEDILDLEIQTGCGIICDAAAGFFMEEPGQISSVQVHFCCDPGNGESGHIRCLNVVFNPLNMTVAAVIPRK